MVTDGKSFAAMFSYSKFTSSLLLCCFRITDSKTIYQKKVIFMDIGSVARRDVLTVLVMCTVYLYIIDIARQTTEEL